MAELEYQGVKFKGGKLFLIISLLSTFSGIVWGSAEIWSRWKSMETTLNNFVSPDLSHYDEGLAVLKSEISSILDEVSLVSEVTRDIKNDLKVQIREMEQDVRHINSIVSAIEDTQKSELRELFQDYKVLEKELDDKIRKALTNPLSGVN
jgi:phosphoglycerate-specific signal transduction histidine kinase